MRRHVQRLWQRALRQLGNPGLLALALLIPALAIAWSLPRQSRKADDLRAALAAKADTLARQREPVQRRISSGEQLVEFVARFPALTQSSDDLDRVFALAKRSKVNLLKGEYQLKPEPNTALVAYTATFPIRVQYATLKAFTADVLEAMPHVSMDELRMSRNDAGADALDSVVRFTFVYRSL